MTREEFMPGWTFLTTQPWGRPYDAHVDAQKAKLQFEFYYDQLKWATREAWGETAKRFAAGQSWPSADELKRATTELNRRYIKCLPEPNQPSTPDPTEAEAILTRILGRPFQFK